MGRRKRQGDPAIAIGYARASTDEQKLGIDGQRIKIEEWCEAHDIQLAALFADRGVSGTKEVPARPAMLEAIEALREHNAGILVAAKRDRIARDPRVAWDAAERVQRAGARLVSADGIGNEDGPEGEFLRGIFDHVAKLERDHIAANTKRALRAKKDAGLRHTNDAPYGWAWDDDDRKVKVDLEQRALKALKRWRREGRSVRWCCDRLTLRGHAPRGAQWHVTTVQRICEREGFEKG